MINYITKNKTLFFLLSTIIMFYFIVSINAKIIETELFDFRGGAITRYFISITNEDITFTEAHLSSFILYDTDGKTNTLTIDTIATNWIGNSWSVAKINTGLLRVVAQNDILISGTNNWYSDSTPWLSTIEFVFVATNKAIIKSIIGTWESE